MGGDVTTTMTNGDTKSAALAAWVASGRTMTGRQIADEYGVSPRTGQNWRAEFEAGGGSAVAVRTPAPPRQTGTARPTGRLPVRRRGKAHPALVAVMVAGAAMVAAVTAVVSYTHIRHLATLHGMGDLAPWVPLGIDGLVVTCAAALTINRRNLVAWAGTSIALVATVWANVLAVPDDPVAQAMAGYSPIALACVVHLVLRQLGDR
jgi:Protein of unknown function (DUF2637)/Homeodomain-like domain